MSHTLELNQTAVHHHLWQDALIRRQLLPLALFLLFFFGMAFIQFVTPNMPDNDGFYHIKLAWLMRTEGLKPDFPFLPLSILNGREFYDHHFLFHVRSFRSRLATCATAQSGRPSRLPVWRFW